VRNKKAKDAVIKLLDGPTLADRQLNQGPTKSLPTRTRSIIACGDHTSPAPSGSKAERGSSWERSGKDRRNCSVAARDELGSEAPRTLPAAFNTSLGKTSSIHPRTQTPLQRIQVLRVHYRALSRASPHLSHGGMLHRVTRPKTRPKEAS